MKRLTVFITAALALVLTTGVNAAGDEDSSTEAVLSSIEASHLVFMREEEKLARDTYITLGDAWGLRVFSNISRSEQTHMDAMLALLNTYGLDDPVVSDAVGSFTNATLAQMYLDLVASGEVSLLDALYVGALIEEVDIRDIQLAIADTAQADIITAYESLIAGSENHLRAFVGQIEQFGVEYVAQVLDQSEVDAILGRTSSADFRINAGLNDAWYYPDTAGQGFFIAVFPDLGVVSLAWFTFDTELPPIDAIANLGDPGHRWLTAVGPIDGNRASMPITLTTGGIFDTPTDVQYTDVPGSDGTLVLSFESCSSGTVEYDIPAINRTGTIPIQRVANDNIALCEALVAD